MYSIDQIITDTIIGKIEKDTGIGLFAKWYKRKKLNNIKQLVEKGLNKFKQENNILDLSEIFIDTEEAKAWAHEIGSEIVKIKNSCYNIAKLKIRLRMNYNFLPLLVGTLASVITYETMYIARERAYTLENMNSSDPNYEKLKSSLLAAYATAFSGLVVSAISIIYFFGCGAIDIVSKIFSLVADDKDVKISKDNNFLHNTYAKIVNFLKFDIGLYSYYTKDTNLLNIIDNIKHMTFIMENIIKNKIEKNGLESLSLKQIDYVFKHSLNSDYEFTSYDFISLYAEKVGQLIQTMFKSVEDKKVKPNGQRDYALSYKEIASNLSTDNISSNIAKYIPISWASRVKQTCKHVNALEL